MAILAMFQAASAAGAIGLGCGTCCSPAISVFLSTYILSGGKGMKKSLLLFATFFLGKTLAIILLCSTASAIGTQFIDKGGYIADFNLKFALQLLMIAVGLFLIGTWIYEHANTKTTCKSCKVRKNNNKITELPLFIVGFIYGITPCTPLLLVASYSATLNLGASALIGSIFALTSTITPVILLIIISGILSKKIAAEIPSYLNWFRLGCYVALTIFSALTMF